MCGENDTIFITIDSYEFVSPGPLDLQTERNILTRSMTKLSIILGIFNLLFDQSIKTECNGLIQTLNDSQ